jgi:hypothetical protein
LERGIVIDVICVLLNVWPPTWVTSSVAAIEGTMMCPAEPKPNLMTIADPPEPQTLTPTITNWRQTS